MASVKSKLELFNTRTSLRRKAFRTLKKNDVKSSSFDVIRQEPCNLTKNDVKSSSFDGSFRKFEGGSR